MSAQELSIVVLNWNRPADTLACLDSLYRSTTDDFEVVVVDNGSSDDSVAMIRNRYPDLTILENQENLGYAGGNNVGIEYALDRGARYVVLLNDDIVVAPEAVTALLSAAEAHPEAGFLGPVVLSADEPDRILSAGRILSHRGELAHRGAGERDEGQYDQVSEVDSLSGSALLVTREAVQRIGLLDPRFFVYYEDADWCYRGRQAGYRLLFVPQARVWHPDAAARDADSALVTYYMARNHLLFSLKHGRGAGAILSSLARYSYRVFKWTVWPTSGQTRRQRGALARAMTDFLLGRFGRADHFR